jgi:hypothetical protein
MLPRRSLVISKGLVSFQCQKSIWRQDVTLEMVDDHTNSPKSDWGFAYVDTNRILTYNPIYGYTDAVEGYSYRKFSFPSDAMDAFLGMGKIIEFYLKSRLYYGIPIAAFDWALLWTTPLSAVRCNDLPSWSWSAWTGRKSKSLEEIADVLIFHTWIIWHYDDPNMGIVRPIRDFEMPGNRMIMSEAQASSRRKLNNDEYYRMAMTTVKQLIQKDDNIKFSLNRFLRYAGGRPLECQVDPFPTGVPLRAGNLRFYTLCAAFTISRPQGTRRNSRVLKFEDKFGNLCGDVHDQSYGGDLGGENIPYGLVNVIVLSEHSGGTENEPEYLEKLSAAGIRSTEPVRRDSWKEFNVMIVEWVENVAYRRALGTILQVALDYAFDTGPVWKEVVLR